jgi:3-isopropylmalate dehydrogenase
MATIWAGSMLLDHLGEREAAKMVLAALGQSIVDGVMTKDMGGVSRTSDIGDYVAALVKKI